MELMKKNVNLSCLPVLYDTPFTPESVARDFEVRGGEWSV